MVLNLYKVDSFTRKLFKGNPSAVIELTEWLDDELMLAIAAENNLAETAFFIKRASSYDLRWFMPYAEIDLCGHATLATAFVIFKYLQPPTNTIQFNSKSRSFEALKSCQGKISRSHKK